MNKLCSKCKKNLELTMFCKRQTKNGEKPSSWCKTCIKDYVIEYRKKKGITHERKKNFVERTLSEEQMKELNELLKKNVSKREISIQMNICYVDLMTYVQKLQRNMKKIK